MRVYTNFLAAFLVLFVPAVLPLPAQTRFTNDALVYIHPSEGGTRAERAFLDLNLPEELKGAGFRLSSSVYRNSHDALAFSDYNITVGLSYDTVRRETILTLKMFDTGTKRLIVSDGVGYKTLLGLRNWDLMAMYRVLANIPVKDTGRQKEEETVRREPESVHNDREPEIVYVDREPEIVYVEQKPEIVYVEREPEIVYVEQKPEIVYAEKPPPRYWLYLGPRAGGVTRFYTAAMPSGGGYLDMDGIGFNFEAGLQARLDFLPWLGIQAEMMITMDSISFIPFVDGEAQKEDTINFMPLMVPVLLKPSFRPGRAIISPYGGIYLNFLLDSDYRFDPLFLGITGGLSLGAKIGPGNIFVDTRYGYDLGDITGASTEPTYRRSMVSISIGYEFGLIKRKPRTGAE
jgi:hypothetical protein